MSADWALQRSFLAHMKMTANGAVPNLCLFALEHFVILDALREHLEALFMRSLNLRQAFEEIAQLTEAFRTSNLCELRILVVSLLNKSFA